jgi:hypothetical protein
MFARQVWEASIGDRYWRQVLETGIGDRKSEPGTNANTWIGVRSRHSHVGRLSTLGIKAHCDVD